MRRSGDSAQWLGVREDEVEPVALAMPSVAADVAGNDVEAECRGTGADHEVESDSTGVSCR